MNKNKLTEYEKFWDEMSKTEEVDYDDEMINRLLRLKAIQSHLSGVHKQQELIPYLWLEWALM